MLGAQATMCWNHDGSLLASASVKGTVLRVHRLPQAAKAFTFRRGTYPAPIHSLAFSPASVQPPLLCAASGHGTVHLFRLEEPDRCCLEPRLSPPCHALQWLLCEESEMHASCVTCSV